MSESLLQQGTPEDNLSLLASITGSTPIPLGETRGTILIKYREESFDFLILDVEDHLSRAIDVASL